MLPANPVSVESELAWAAGFFDGEGSTSILKAQRDKYSYIRISISQKYPECLERFQRAIGFGKIYKANKRNIYSWDCYKQSDVQIAFSKIEPYLSSIKIKQFYTALEKVKGNSKNGV